MARTSSLLKHKAVLQRRIFVGEDEYCMPIPDWEDVTVLRCSFEHLKGREFFAGMGNNGVPQRIAEVEARVRIRERKGLDPANHRLVFGGVNYNIVAIIPDYNRRQTQLMVKAIASDQDDGASVNE